MPKSTQTANIHEDIENRFTYHPPKPGQPEQYTRIRRHAKNVALRLISECPPSRELSLALTKLEEAVFWANAAIARHGKAIPDETAPEAKDNYGPRTSDLAELNPQAGQPGEPTFSGLPKGESPSQLAPIDDSVLIDMLGLVDVTVTRADLTRWTPDMAKEAEEWAGAVHLDASDNEDVVVPPKPLFLPESDSESRVKVRARERLDAQLRLDAEKEPDGT